MEKYVLTSDKVKIYYQIMGQGPALFLLHGNSQTSNIFKHLIKRLKSHYTCFAIDTRGHGKSKLNGKLLNFSRMSQDVIEIMDAENLQRVHLLGFSDGANIAMLLASRHPSRVERLILNAGNSSYLGLYSPIRLTVRVLNLFPHLIGRNSATLKLLLEDVISDNSELQNITAPTLIVNGQFDVVKTSHTQELVANIPDSQLLIIPWGSHLSFYFRPNNFSHIVCDFLEKVKQPRA